MSFLGSIKNYVENALGIKSTPKTAVEKKSSEKIKTQVINGKGSPVGETLELGNSKPIEATKSNVMALKATIDDACVRNGIDSKELYKILLSMAGLKNMKEFQTKLTPEQQLMYLGLVGKTIERAEKHNAKNNKHIDITKTVVVDVQLTLNALEKKTFKNAKEVTEFDNNKTIKNSSKKLLENINSLSEEEMDEAIAEYEAEIKGYVDAEMEKINRITNSKERAEAIERLKERIAYQRDRVYNEVLMKADNEHASDAISIVNSKHLPQAVHNLYGTRRNAYERRQTAEYYSFERVQERVIKRYYDKGDELSVDVYKEFITVNVSHMSQEARQSFSDDYFTARQNYEQNGYPEYMKKEMLQATATSIAAGIQMNEFMTGEEKASAISDFYQREENSENVKQQAEVIVEKKAQTASDDKVQISVSERAESLTTEYVTEQFFSVKNTEDKTEKHKNDLSKVTKPEEVYSYSGAASKAKIEFVLNTAPFKPEDIAKTLRISEEKVYKIIFSKGNLIEKYKQGAVNYITEQNKVSTLVDLAKSPKAIELILTYSRVDNKDELKQKLEKKATSFQRYLFDDKEDIRANAAN